MRSHLANEPTVRVVHSFHELLATPFAGECNAICWERSPAGDASALLRSLPVGEGVMPVDESRLRDLDLGSSAELAARGILEDLRCLREAGHGPELNLIGAYPHDPTDDLPTDVYSFHVDSAPVPAETFLCTYAGLPSEILRRADALAIAEVPELRARLLERHGGKDDVSFTQYLEESHQGLHYLPRAGACPISLGVGNLWRLAVEFPGAPVKACIHRAPLHGIGDGLRLLIIS